MWGELNLWLSDENLEVEIPDSDSLHADLSASPYSRDSHDRICLWKKERIKSEYGFSPDEGDAIALTFGGKPKKKEKWKKIRYNDDGIV